MKVIITGFIIALFLFLGCEKSEVSQFDLKGTLTGKIFTRTELNREAYDNDSITILLDGSDPVLSATTDSLGNYEIGNIPSGTYNLIISKEGYGDVQLQGFQIVGGNEPIHFDCSITGNSTTTIENLSIEIINSDEVFIKGTVFHNYDLSQIYDPWPTVRYFIHTNSEPTSENFMQTSELSFNGVSGSEMSSRIYVDQNLFPSGTKIYVIVYGSNQSRNSYFNVLEGKYFYTALGTPSNVASINIP